MAVSFTKASASQYSLKYVVGASAGSGESGTKSATALLADCAAGPLKAFLGGLNSAGESWFELERGSDITLTYAPIGGGSLAAISFDGSPNTLSATSGDDPGSWLVEIRLNHSLSR